MGTRVRYTNFDLTVGAFEKNFFVSATLPGQGVVLGHFTLPFQRDEILEWRHGLNEKLAQEIGGALYDAVFQNELRFALQDALRYAARNQDHLRLRLNLDAHANRLPWELLYQRTTHQFLALDEHLSIVRQPTILEPLEPLLMNFPLRLLAITAQAREAEHLDLDAEKAILVSAARAWSAEKILLDWLEQPSLEQVRQTLQAKTYHILHFIGHGRSRPDAEAGEIQLVYPSGQGQWVTAAQWSRIIRSERALRVVIMNACDSGRTSSDNPFSGVAAELIRTGDVSAAIAMQFPLTDNASRTFTRGFYQSLLQDNSLDAAVTQGRLAIDADVNHYEWATPALYLHAADGELMASAPTDDLPALEPIPTIPKFVGRAQALDTHRRALAENNFAIIQGMPGIGKTTLGAFLAHEQAASGRTVFWISFDATSKNSGEIFVREIAGMFKRDGDARLWDYLEQESASKKHNPTAWFSLLLNCLAKKQYTLCFDDLHLVQLDPAIQQLFARLQKQFLGQPQNIPAKFIVMTRSIPPYMQYLGIEPLPGLSYKELDTWLQNERIVLSTEQLKRLDDKIEGNPQFLRLALLAGLVHQTNSDTAWTSFIEGLAGQRDVRNYLLNEMYQRLQPDEQQILNLLCISERFESLHAVQYVGMGEAVRNIALHIDSLSRQNLVLEKENGYVGLHALVRHWCYRNLDEDVKRRLHLKAGEFADTQRDFLVAAMHYRKAKMPTRAALTLVANKNELLARGGSASLREEIEKIERQAIDLGLWIQLVALRGEAFSSYGNESAAADLFRQALGETNDPAVRAELTERVARSLNMRGDFADAVPYFQDALAQSNALSLTEIAARANLGIANALTHLEHFQDAVLHAEKAIQLGQKIADTLLMAEAQIQRAIIALEMNETLQAIQLLQESLITFQKFSRIDLMADANLELGVAYQKRGNFAVASDYYRAAVSLYEQGWDLVRVASALNNLGDLEMVRGNYADAARYLERALQLADEYDNSFYRVLVRYSLGDTYLRINALAQAKQTIYAGLEICKDLEYTALYAGLLRLLAEIFDAEGKQSNAASAFEQALNYLTTKQVLDPYEWLALYLNYGKFLLKEPSTRSQGCDYLQKALPYANESNTLEIDLINRLLVTHCIKPAN